MDGSEEASDSGGFRPWTEAELEEFEELAKRAVGFSELRGDEITVTNAPFITPGLEDPEAGWLTPDLLSLLASVLHGAAFLVGLLLFSRLFVRPLAEAVGGSDSAAVESLREEVLERLSSVGQTALAGGAEGAGDGLRAEDLEIPGLVEQNEEMTLQQQVDRVAQLRTEDSVRTIRGWMAS